MPALVSKRLISRLYQLYRLSSSFLYAALLTRWLILLPLVGSKFLPGGIHEYLCYLMLYSSVVELLWLYKFRGFCGATFSRTFVKDLNMLYFVVVMHFYDDYEYALILKNSSYSSFIIGLAWTQAHCHWCKLFKSDENKKKGWAWKVETFFMMPLLYMSEMYLLLLNVQNPSFHSTPLLDEINKVILITFLPIALSLYKYQF